MMKLKEEKEVWDKLIKRGEINKMMYINYI